MIIMIDNYDSFTYNLYQYFGALNPDIEVYRNDKIDVNSILSKNPDHIVISPGPGYPENAGVCIELIKRAGNIPLMGVCLGHQAIGEAFGGKIVHAPQIMHGRDDKVSLNTDCQLFKGFPQRTTVGRYHSLVIDKKSLPNCLEITAEADDGSIMGVKHKERPIYGIQFHPESVLTESGQKIIENFLNIKKKY